MVYLDYNKKTRTPHLRAYQEGFRAREVMKMNQVIEISFANNQTIEKIYQERKRRGNGKVRNDINSSNEEEDDEVFLLDPKDYEERLGKGFRIFEMATNGYPSDC